MGVERAVSILESESRSVDRNRLVEGSEQVLFGVANQVLPEVARSAAQYDYESVYRALAPLRPAVDKFFDDVLVMAEDESVRRNRLALLSFVNVLYRTLADFTKVVV
jgi:glycyl-tRNA synthetase beta chain